MQINNSLDLSSTLDELVLYDVAIESDRPGPEVTQIFENNPLLPGIILKQKGEFVGMISRRRFFENIINHQRLELFSKQPLLMFYRFSQMAILVLDINTPILMAVKLTLQRSNELIYEPIVVQTKQGEHKVLDVHQLILAQLQIHELATSAMRESQAQLKLQAQQLESALRELQRTQSQLIHTEKMSSLGQLVAGVAHEINNPISFIYGNLPHAHSYIKNLLQMLNVYQKYCPADAPEIKEAEASLELEYLVEDLPQLLHSMQDGAERIRQIVLSLRNFCRLDEAQMKRVNIHEGLDNTIMLLDNRLKAQNLGPMIEIERYYERLPVVECYPGQLNQVFMNILSNAIQALEEKIKLIQKNSHHQEQEMIDFVPKISIYTKLVSPEVNSDYSGRRGDRNSPQLIQICIKDNGPGMNETVKKRLFDPFFTTKPVGQGTGLGLSISYEIIVNQHGGKIWCEAELGKEAEFFIEIPIRQTGLNTLSDLV